MPRGSCPVHDSANGTEGLQGTSCCFKTLLGATSSKIAEQGICLALLGSDNNHQLRRRQLFTAFPLNGHLSSRVNMKSLGGRPAHTSALCTAPLQQTHCTCGTCMPTRPCLGLQGLDNMHKLQLLELGDNRLATIEGLGALRQLQELWLGRNRITHIAGLDRCASHNVWRTHIPPWATTSGLATAPVIVWFQLEILPVRACPQEHKRHLQCLASKKVKSGW